MGNNEDMITYNKGFDDYGDEGFNEVVPDTFHDGYIIVRSHHDQKAFS